MNKYLTGVVLLLLVCSCSLFTKEQPDAVVARVNEQYLLKEEIASQIPQGLTGNDSIQFVAAFIDNWATQELLIQGSKRNLSQETQDRYNQLVQGYKQDLYIKAYKDALVQKVLDSTVSDQEAAVFYEANKQNFNLNEDLVQMRYIHVSNDYNHLEKLKAHFIDFEETDKYVIDSLSLQFKSFFLNDSTWLKRSQVKNKIAPFRTEVGDKLLKKSNYVQLRDSLGLYLVAVNGTLSRNNIAPMEYVRPTINQIIVNKRKLELVKRLEKEIKEDAIKDKRFEIYK